MSDIIVCPKCKGKGFIKKDDSLIKDDGEKLMLFIGTLGLANLFDFIGKNRWKEDCDICNKKGYII